MLLCERERRVPALGITIELHLWRTGYESESAPAPLALA